MNCEELDVVDEVGQGVEYSYSAAFGEGYLGLTAFGIGVSWKHDDGVAGGELAEADDHVVGPGELGGGADAERVDDGVLGAGTLDDLDGGGE